MDGLNKRLDIEGEITSETEDFFSKAAFDNRNEKIVVNTINILALMAYLTQKRRNKNKSITKASVSTA